jgi:hypothetical protein
LKLRQKYSDKISKAESYECKVYQAALEGWLYQHQECSIASATLLQKIAIFSNVPVIVNSSAGVRHASQSCCD